MRSNREYDYFGNVLKYEYDYFALYLSNITQSNLKQIFSPFITKGVYSFRRFNRDSKFILNCWRSHRESFRNKKLI